MADESRPRGGVTPRKYAAMCLALGMARGALHGAIAGADVEEIKHFLDVSKVRRPYDLGRCRTSR
jgi:hypothetical protein